MRRHMRLPHTEKGCIMEYRELTCIVCPKGCQMRVSMQDGQITEITGNTCRRGAEYAGREVTHPVRTVTGTVRLYGGRVSVLPVKTAKEIPKELVMDCARALAQASVQAPVRMGDVVIADFAGTGTDIVATRSVPAAE